MYFVVPENKSVISFVASCASEQEARMFAEGEKIRTGDEYDVIHMARLYRTRTVTPREAAKIAAEIERKRQEAASHDGARVA